ncbi:hypothetical protein [Ruminobacter sp.]|uniref:hypothetical protein n=1 Tax=Ruminobacter sp. TaxID=2774296 RepID=UPI003867E52E
MDLGRKGCFNEESIYKRTGFIFGGNFLLVLGGQIFTRVTKGRKLDLKTITGIYPKNTPVTEIIEHLCNYINSFKTVERNEDVRSICNLITELKNQKECYSVLESKYTETLNELCESRKKQIEQSATNKELSLLPGSRN